MSDMDAARTLLMARSGRLAPYLGPMLVAGGVLLGTAYVAVVDPDTGDHYPLCPFKSLTGWDCPGCGGLRAVHALTRGNVGAALDQNLLVTAILLPLAIGTWVAWVLRIRAAGGARSPGPARPGAAPAPRSRLQRWGPYALLALMVVFTVVRNLPGVPYLRSGIG